MTHLNSRVVFVCFVLATLLFLPQIAVSENSLSYSDSSWIKYGSSSVLPVGSLGSWDDLHVVVDSTVLVGSTYHLYYRGTSDNYVWNIGHATSSNGINWTRDTHNPIMMNAIDFHVIFENGEFKAWYEDYSTIPYDIHYAISSDGSIWQQGSAGPVLTISPSGWDSGVMSSGPVLHNATGYSMWYSATEDGMTWSVGLATSGNGINWTKYSGNPVLAFNPSVQWRSQRVHAESIISESTGLVLWIVGSDLQTQRIGVATSIDGRIWQQSVQPILDIGPPENWDSESLSSLSVLPVNDGLWMWYTGKGTPNSFSIGLATTKAVNFTIHDSGKDYSIMVPPGWTITDDEMLAGNHTDSYIRGPVGYGIHTNVIVLTGIDSSIVNTQEYLQNMVDDAKSAVEQSLGIGLTLTGALQFQNISNYSAVLFGLDYSGYDLHQQGAVIIDAEHSRYWIVTCTESKQARMQFDPIFDAMTNGISIEPVTGTFQIEFFVLAIIAGTIGGAVLLVATFIFLRKKRGRI
jgi:hypothetical protein